MEARWYLSADPIVTVDTNFGNFQIELLPGAAPQSVANFLSYVTSGAYTNTIFHRSVPLTTPGGIGIIQTGGFTSASTTFTSTSQFATIPTNAPIPLEYNLPNAVGTVAMARTSDLNSATDQWFINTADDTNSLGQGNHGGYAVFGKILGNGMQVINSIAAFSTTAADNGVFATLPLGPNSQLVRISSITVDSIDGTVFTDSNGNAQLDSGEPGVAGRTVYVDKDGSGTLTANDPQTTTDANGNYSFSGLATGNYTVREVLPPGIATSTTNQTFSVTSGQTTTGANLGEVAGVSGTVFVDLNGNSKLDAGEPGLGGQTVFVNVDHSGSPANNPHATTASNGSFTIAGVAPGTYPVLEVLPSGITLTTPSQSATVAGGVGVSGLVFGEMPSIAGTVFVDTNGNGQLDSGEQGVAGRTVFLNIDNTGAPDANNPSTTTDANGNYFFLGLAAGSYHVKEVLPNHVTLTTSAQTATVAADAVANINFGDMPSIAGAVFIDENGNAQFDSSEPGVPGQTVFIDKDGTGAPTANDPQTITDSNGAYSFSGLAPGQYTVMEVLPSGVTVTTGTQSVTVADGTTKSSVNFGDRPSITGKVFADSNGNGQLDSGEQGVAGRTVFIDKNNNGTLDSGEPTAVTNASGNYAFLGLPAGNYTVAEVVAPGVTLSTKSSASVAVAANLATAGVNFGEAVDTTTAEIRGTVFQDVNLNGLFDSGELGLAGRVVFVDVDGSGAPGPKNPSATTDANGNYSLRGAPAGTFTVREVVPANHGVTITTPVQSVALIVGQTVTAANFGNVLMSTLSPLPVSPGGAGSSSNSSDPNAAYIDAVYQSVLGRAADAASLTYWQGRLTQGASRADVARGVWDSTEHRSSEIEQYYHTFLGRASDAVGKAFWLQTYSDPTTFDTLANEKLITSAFLTSDEYSQRLHASNTDFITALYQDIDNRAPDAKGLSDWTTALQGGQTRLQVINAFLNNQEASTQLIDGFYADFLHRTVDAAGQQTWDGALQNNSASIEDVAVKILATDEFFARVKTQNGL